MCPFISPLFNALLYIWITQSSFSVASIIFSMPLSASVLLNPVFLRSFINYSVSQTNSQRLYSFFRGWNDFFSVLALWLLPKPTYLCLDPVFNCPCAIFNVSDPHLTCHIFTIVINTSGHLWSSPRISQIWYVQVITLTHLAGGNGALCPD